MAARCATRPRRGSGATILLAVAAIGVLALLALAAAFVAAPVTDDASRAGDAAASAMVAIDEHEHTVPPSHVLDQWLSTRARSAAFAVLAATLVVAISVLGQFGRARTRFLRTARVAGLPPGRAPPRLRIA